MVCLDPESPDSPGELPLDWDGGVCLAPLSVLELAPSGHFPQALIPLMKLFIKPEPCTNRADEGPASPLA